MNKSERIFERGIYKYQIKFTNGESHEFDLRGKYPTVSFKEKLEEYWNAYVD
ncbi:hypothetical protein R5H55_001897 [Enterococcus faecium]|nr:hypothetical protein [Enterococcus faecium]